MPRRQRLRRKGKAKPRMTAERNQIVNLHLNRTGWATIAATAALSAAVVFSIAPTTRADDKADKADKADKTDSKECCTTAADAPEGLAKDAMTKLKALTGTWSKKEG